MRHVVYDVSDVATWACWALVGVVWVAGAVLTRRHGPPVERRGGRDAASLGGFAAALLAIRAPASLWRPLTVASPWIRLAGVPLLLLAAAGAIWARAALGSMWSSSTVTKEHHELRTSGPYNLTRHPIYTALLAMLAATALTQGLGRWVAVVAAAALVLLTKALAEERLLSTEFPGAYERYRLRVPRLIPRVGRRRDQDS